MTSPIIVSDREFATWQAEQARLIAADAGAGPDWIDQVLARLDVHGLPHVNGGPGIVGSCCPVCSPELLPFGTAYARIPMVIQFVSSGVRFICRDGCDEHEISAALDAPPRARSSA